MYALRSESSLHERMPVSRSLVSAPANTWDVVCSSPHFEHERRIGVFAPSQQHPADPLAELRALNNDVERIASALLGGGHLRKLTRLQ